MSRLVISLSSVPPRFDKTWQTLECLLAQTAPVDAVNLYIPKTYRRFPDWDGTPPAVPDGVQICRVDEDWGPSTKVLAAAREFRGQDVDILFCDDDRRYGPGWAQKFLDTNAQALVVVSSDGKKPVGIVDRDRLLTKLMVNLAGDQ